MGTADREQLKIHRIYKSSQFFSIKGATAVDSWKIDWNITVVTKLR